MPKNHSEVVYRVDARGRLTFVNEGWNTFAKLNDSPELCGPGVLGRRVADGFAGPETPMIYERLMQRAAAGVRLELPYRCDSPMLRRRMILTIVAVGTEVEFRSRMVDVAMRPVMPVLDAQRPRSEEFLTVCSWCNRGRIGARWAELEDVVAQMSLFETEMPKLTHGMCPDCQVRVTAELAP